LPSAQFTGTLGHWYPGSPERRETMAYKILVVDDDKNIAEIEAKILKQEGYEIVIANDGEEALLKMEQEKPDIVVLDLMMPKKNGFEVLQEIRTKYKKWIPVIISSGENDLDAVKKSYSLEADHYLTKPCPMEHLIRGVRTMVSLIPLRINETK
jgi:DNA-binding response OmpR family regulator